jgi:hypothetical protein
MSRILLIPVAVLLAAGGVILGPGEQAPASPAQTVVTPAGEMGNQSTDR